MAHHTAHNTHHTTGQMWGALENLNMISMSILVKQASLAEESELSACLMRYSRLAMILTFRALQTTAETDTLEDLLVLPNRNFSTTSESSDRQVSSFAHSVDAGSGNSMVGTPPAKQQELMTEEERQWLLAATPGVYFCCVYVHFMHCSRRVFY